jgi:hypothetical protein
MSKPEDFKFDSRVRERLLRGRSLSTADLQRHLDALPDLEGEYELLNDPQPAVTPPRDHAEEPLMFDGIRRLQALAEPHPPARPSASFAASPAAVAPPREPPGRGLGALDVGRGPSPALRSALMESEISGVGAGAVSAALGAMSAEARTAAGFPPVVPVPPASATPPEEPQTPVTLRSRAAPEGLAADDAAGVADWEAPYPDSEDMT